MAVGQLVVAIVEVFGSLLTAKPKVQSRILLLVEFMLGRVGLEHFLLFFQTL
jgi:predicted nucleotidyltransferase